MPGLSTRLRLVLAALWLAASVVGVLVAALTKIGPVLVALPGHEHGLHLGDVVGIVLCYGMAADLTRRLLRRGNVS